MQHYLVVFKRTFFYRDAPSNNPCPKKTMNPTAAFKLFQRRKELYNKPFNAIIALTKPEQLTQQVNKQEQEQKKSSNTTSSTTTTESSSSLSGVPIAIKEVIDVAGFPTTLCDPALKKSFASALYTRAKSSEQEANIVTLLRESGAVIVGKTNIPLKGLDVQCSNPIHGLTTNPWDPLRTPGGSSGGSAAAVATGMVPLALGTDLAGSLRIPAAFCGITSMRCSYGVISTHGHQPPAAPSTDPEAESTMQLGPLARDVRTLERFFRGTQLLKIPQEKKKEDETILNIGMSTGLGGMECDHSVKSFLERYAKKGMELTNISDQAHSDINLKKVGQTYMTYAKRYFVEMNGRSDEKKLLSANEYRQELRSDIDSLIGDFDCWMLPTCPIGVAFKHNPTQSKMSYSYVDSDTIVDDSLDEHNNTKNNQNILTKMMPYWPLTLTYVMPFTITGHPVVTMPVGHIVVDEETGVVLPVGMQVVGRRGEDVKLLKICRMMEDRIWGRKVGPPLPNGIEKKVDGLW